MNPHSGQTSRGRVSPSGIARTRGPPAARCGSAADGVLPWAFRGSGMILGCPADAPDDVRSVVGDEAASVGGERPPRRSTPARFSHLPARVGTFPVGATDSGGEVLVPPEPFALGERPPPH